MPTYLSFTATILLVWIFWRLRIFLGITKGRVPYPPGPKPRPLIGNMFDFPNHNAASEYANWGRKYNSAIVYAESLGNHVIVLNNLEDADELFTQRSKKYSDRPTIPLIELMGWGINVAFMPYGDVWRLHRRICQESFRPEAVRESHWHQMRKVHQMLQGLLKTPEDFDGHSKMLSVSLTMSSLYGYEVESFEDPCVSAAERSTLLASQLVIPGASLINIFPILGRIPPWIPGASSHKMAAEIRRLTKMVYNIPLEVAKKNFERGTAVPSLVTSFLEKKYTSGASKEEEDAINNVAYAVYGAASDTTISATGTFFYTMAVNPDIQKKAQAEIDRVIGSRLPTFEDRESLPYVEAIYREVMRYNPPVPLGVPHSVSADDYYKGYFIPKGTAVFGNIWAMTHNEEIYHDPFTFKPERFFDQNGKLNDDDRVLAYGFGRRICAGKHMASATMWLTIASVLAAFNIEKLKDAAGNDIDINNDFEDHGILSHKAKFKCSFKVRSATFEKLIADTHPPG